ncbi:50S ribosomal protein L6 [uncultured archaeon]|nr:50S ribosomal protein L6 [uncultured archaeon]
MAEFLAKTIKLPSELHATLAGDTLTLKGPKGTLTRQFKSYRIKISVEGNKIIVEGTPKNKQTDVLVETITSHIENMAEGLVYGYKYNLKVLYSHFPMSIQVEKDAVNIKNFLGEKFPRRTRIMGATKVEVKGQDITVSGIDKEAVGQTASNMERKTKVKNKDIRRYQDGIYIVETGNMEAKKAPAVEVLRGKV